MPARFDAIVLAGGRGRRLAAVVPDVPKPLAPVAGRPFLDYLIAQLAASGIVERAVLALGHLADKVVEHYRDHPPPLPVEFSFEDAPLGTGGALLWALPLTVGDSIIACNGDSLAVLDFGALVRRHLDTGAEATLALVSVPDASRYGRVELGGDKVVRFVEKAAGPGLINAGIYVFRRRALLRFRPGPSSLERDILPVLVAQGRLTGMVTEGPFLDIGLPEAYAQAEDFVRRLRERVEVTNR